MSFIKNNNKYLNYNEDEPPTKKIVSEGDILIKDLAYKQRNQNINLQEYLKKEQHFEKLAEHISFTSCNSGALPLEKFKVAVEQLEHIETLRSCNLTNDDIKFMLSYKNGNIYDEYKNVEPNVLQSRISSTLQLIKEHEEKSQLESNVEKKTISHKQNEALAIKPNSVETKLLKFALENKSTHAEKNSHPMDDIKCIEKELFSHLYDKKLIPSKIQKHLRRCARKMNAEAPAENHRSFNGDSSKKSQPSFVINSKWDKQNIELNSPTTVDIPNKVYTCKPQNYYTVKNGQIIKLNYTYEKIKIKENKLTVEEIKAIPRFENYDPGLPSKTLYLKNLPKCIQELDLKEIFREFTSSNTLLFRVMTGKMKAQAFVTFPGVDIASKALNALNGTLVNDKPIVIEFGKKKNI